MENIKNNFIDFLVRVVLPNLKGYSMWINGNNVLQRINELETNYISAFGLSPFELDLNNRKQLIDYIQSNKLTESGSEFQEYNKKSGNGIPNALINTHLVRFINYYYQDVEFEVLQDIVDRLHKELTNSFCEKFQRERIQFNGKSKISSSSKIFGDVRDNYWTINLGSEQEIQYHIFYNGERIGYGLAFNAQPSQNNTTPVDTVKPFIKSFLSNEMIKNDLSDYHYIQNNEDTLKNISSGDFVCYGKEIEVDNVDNETNSVSGLSFLEMVYDIKNKQFEAYKAIWNGVKTVKKQQTVNMEYINLIKFKKQIIFQGAPGTGKTYTAKDIAEQLLYNEVSIDKKRQADRLKEKNNQFKLIQFHPAYTYEDFVRGIVVDTTNGSPDYKTINKPLAHFAKQALDNWVIFNLEKENKANSTIYAKSKIEQFIDSVQLVIDEKGKYQLTDNVYLSEYDDSRFKYKGDNWEAHANGLNMKYSELRKILDSGFTERALIKKIPNIESLTGFHATYYTKLAEKFAQFSPQEIQVDNIEKDLKNFVLIIDEINRANLPAVLGELIYGLEYRGEKVDSMYAIDGDHSLILPPNLFIIGTMNTADRSVGLIDYAIRRRFAFVDMLPKVLPEGIGFNIDLFKEVSSFFIKNIDEYIADEQCKLIPSDLLSDEFRPEDVWIGHSYFIMNDKEGNDITNTRIKYEIIPILKEYVKDGIFKDKTATENKIDNLLSSL